MTVFSSRMLLLICALAIVMDHAPGQESVSGTRQATIRISSDLTLVDVIAVNAKSGLFDGTLTKSDLQVFDQGHQVSVRTFDTGIAARPLAVWFVVRCGVKSKRGTTSPSDEVSLLKQSLIQLHAEDLVGVAQWCEDGSSRLALLPTRDTDRAVQVLEQIDGPSAAPSSLSRSAANALWATLHSVIDTSMSLVPERTPLIVLLNERNMLPAWEVDYLDDELLRTSTAVYTLDSSRSQHSRTAKWRGHQDVSLEDHLAAETGGQVVSRGFGAGLRLILDSAHARYELGFAPAVPNGRRHAIRVALSPAAKADHRGVILRYRSEYLAPPPG